MSVCSTAPDSNTGTPPAACAISGGWSHIAVSVLQHGDPWSAALAIEKRLPFLMGTTVQCEGTRFTRRGRVRHAALAAHAKRPKRPQPAPALRSAARPRPARPLLATRICGGDGFTARPGCKPLVFTRSNPPDSSPASRMKSGSRVWTPLASRSSFSPRSGGPDRDVAHRQAAVLGLGLDLQRPRRQRLPKPAGVAQHQRHPTTCSSRMPDYDRLL